MFIPVVMAGGSGTRLWPLSRKQFPKQFLNLTADNSMLQQTLQRLNGTAHGAPILVANESHRFLVAEQLREAGIHGGRILLEPFGRNTAPAIALAALMAAEDSPENTLLVLAADHVIADVAAFQAAIAQAETLAEQGRLVTFGIVPDAPETGYGYIRKGAELGEQGFEVAEFVEKPDLTTARDYLASGEFFWNSGMFMFKAGAFLAELEKHQPEVLAVCRQALAKLTSDTDFDRIPADIFEQCPDISVDYAVMEHTSLAAMVPLSAGWNDVGSWSALWQVADKDDQGNSLRGDVIAEDSRNSLVMAEHRLVGTVGVEDLVVVETKDAVMVAHRDRVQDVKKIVEQLKQQSRTEADANREVYRPWGHYDSIDSGERYQVKRICVAPGAKLSVQMHHHRAEHWVVVSGTAKVTCNDKEILLTENQSTFIPVGAVHSLENPGKIPLEVIEVQSGAYLGEDDIVRFEDLYGRAQI
ncbi:mannose-1-phosphate guanylyltransferase/mannose-6-phosphate isomerase [Marinobacterium arenosum]|uniref:mannose-1-phosphate guanylyltransferase/mannose-6-phosphate isomerase n=1 Tax=Marinobacterium arenosum TaxID=2862496 RepID=UPI001C9795E3|nr:mannose-1-phosphate guanylyltransferase/mannose-6-phosphate isomerase [Marinobacterium arenosum]MBY4676408.1 mannose-1-phosphate guanylyltransferase/mannose-6-phosphate isomerase [Marinobacterium arenosum]